MPALTLFESVKKGVLRNIEISTPYCVLLVGMGSVNALYAIEFTDNKTYQYAAIMSMYSMYYDALRISAYSAAGGVIKGAWDYYWDNAEENQENIRHSM